MGLGQLCVQQAPPQAVPADSCSFAADSDAKGRVPAFNLTLCVTGVFGMAAAFAPSFGTLCLALFLLGTGVGGSMPTDGTLCVLLLSPH